MAEFNIGYPKKTGDVELDYTYLYNFVCEMSDRLSYQFSQLNRINETNQGEAAEETSE